MILALTGTPGTGKTSVAEELDEFRTVDLTEFVKKYGLGEQKEEFEVDTDTMVQKLEEELDRDKDVLIEGHLAHHFPADYCIVLRCRPDVLRERLSERDYSEEKVETNVESEILDVILSEAVEVQDKVIEIDTTDRTAGETAEELREKVEKGESSYGDTDWSRFI